MNKQAKLMTNVVTYIIIIFLIGIVVTGILLVGNETLLNPNAALDNDSVNYIANLNGVNLSEWNTTSSEVEGSILVTGNTSQGNPKDYGLDFLFAKEKGLGIELVIKGIFSMPQLILYDILRFDKNNWDWIVKLFNWVWRISIVIALVFFARGINDK